MLTILLISILVLLLIIIVLSELDQEDRVKYLDITSLKMKNFGKNFLDKLLKHIERNVDFPIYAILITILLFFAFMYRFIFLIFYYLSNIIKYAIIKSATRRRDWPI